MKEWLFEESFCNCENPTKVKQFLKYLITSTYEFLKIPRTLENKKSAELLPQYIVSNSLLPTTTNCKLKKKKIDSIFIKIGSGIIIMKQINIKI